MISYMAELENFNYLVQKAQKITEALYRVTDLFPEEEPLKWKLRKKAMDIFSKIVELKDIPTYKKAQNLEGIFHTTSRILNFLELASASSFISHLNFEVLKREYLHLVEFIKDKKEEFLPTEILMPTRPLVPDVTDNKEGLEQEKEISRINPNIKEDNGHSQYMSDSLSFKESSKKYMSDRNVNKSKKSAALKDKTVTFEDQKPITYKEAILNKANRKREIISILTSQNWVSIKDIFSSFQGVSTKTIQRELSTLVAEGILKKTGERRWRRYSLKKRNNSKE